MDRLKVFDKALYAKQIGGNGIIVIADTIYLVTGVFFGMMSFQSLCSFILAVNMFTTCILYHNFIVSIGDMGFELNTKKIIYYPTTRLQFLLNKYAKTLIFLVIQLSLSLACLGLGYLGSRGGMPGSTAIGGLLMVYISILLTSGVSIVVMHTMPMGIYLSMILYFPLFLFSGVLEKLLTLKAYTIGNIYLTVFLIILVTTALWLALLWIGKLVYEKIS